MNELNIIEKNERLINKWNDRLSTTKEIQHQLNSLIRIVNKRKKEYPNLIDMIPCNGYIISKILQMQGCNFQYSKPEFEKCYYNVKESNDNYISIYFKKSNGGKIHFNINIMEDK